MCGRAPGTGSGEAYGVPGLAFPGIGPKIHYFGPPLAARGAKIVRESSYPLIRVNLKPNRCYGRKNPTEEPAGTAYFYRGIFQCSPSLPGRRTRFLNLLRQLVSFGAKVLSEMVMSRPKTLGILSWLNLRQPSGRYSDLPDPNKLNFPGSFFLGLNLIFKKNFF